ncbi:putative disease resistance protein RGA4 [Quercus robur]|uniref:putative disease resistance protein RGA4 n=1 Tax=Quercus robur TaxID=38942 RepID=UPI0021632F08|nr:putative disease resistance protein RGA4 [Quercus robur]XP_050262355.1 putative disease resistance protein RGA4 [Quercus robur]XP_050262356.1 putative disease resistance protein RGA4 [Quercus robur]XP_050262357.1 putative disease resistance protein RGA4 [Quercus robur]XP_050262359.1 putative disease resistance protein RGA4 [Quercus robur]XP_050262360.1 putative disease resistance protein RGA4 [Quercus robur]XP_050262361.1 putative disease resistance protein RGA4 [Quercus robur]XP_05026236
MADAILYGVVQKIIESLGSSTLKKIRSIRGVQDELEKMNNTVLTIQAVLEDAEEQQVKNHQVKDWLMKLRDAAFDADDLLSEFSTYVLQQEVMDGHKIAKKVRTFFSSSNQLVFGNEMAGKLSAMRERFNDIASDRHNFQLIERPLETRAVSRERETHSFVRDKEVIGRKEDKKAIIGLLQDSDAKENVSFISIVGIGGLGKTTLAQYVYNDETVKAHFELKIWVCVSEVFDVKTIVENIIISATDEKPKSLIMEHLQNKLREILNQKMYLLVLDDVWNENEDRWDELRTLLLGGKRGSKVVITTRAKLVADLTSSISQYPLEGLSDDQSWALLKRMAFEEEQETISTNFKAIGMDILKKCKGVPLAIKIIGRVLNDKKTEAEWSYIKNIELSKVPKLKDGIMPVLKLSYDHLPSYLKCCFAYCSLFPKDYLIDKLTLIQLWIAQGFIQSLDENLLLVDVANDYFKELLWRSFFQEVEEDEGMTSRFKMHDLIHDLAQYVSETDCTLVDTSAKNVKETGHHLSFPFYNVSFFEENLNTLVKANKIRTFILAYNKWEYDQGTIEESTLKKLISTFRYVRVLDLHGLNMKMLPNTLGTLMHLKYLDLSSNDIEVLPSCIIKLVNLQTLKLSRCKKLRELPVDIQKLVSLKHLHIDGCENLTHMPCGLGQITSLQTLTLFVVSKGSVGSFKHCGGLAGLKKLNDLRGKLEIKNLAWVKDASSEFKVANLKEKQHLSELELSWNLEGDDAVDTCDDENSMDGLQPHQSLKSLNVNGYMGVRFSSWLSFLTNLVELRIYNCKKCQYLPPLYQLPSLRQLIISNMDGLEYMTDGDMNDEISASLASPSTFFPSLEDLRIGGCLNLKGWWRSVDKGNEATTTSTISSSSSSTNHIPLPSFPRLSCFYLWNCPKMTCMPLFPNLEKKLYLWNSSLKALEETIEMNNRGGRASSFPSSSSSSSFSPPLSKLKKLELWHIQELESLPEEWFKNLTSLETLQIRNCPNLTSLPEGMSHLTSLHTLNIITGCPQLKQRCENENGEDWDKISHIPNLRIY